METLDYERVRTQRWRDLYIAALFEGDRNKLPKRLCEAEQALLLRTRELFTHSGAEGEEWHAVQKALYALRSLRYCFKVKDRGAH